MPDHDARAAFKARLHRELEALAVCEARDDFGRGAATLGAELELSLVDAAGRPALVNEEIIEATGDPHCTVELDRFNLEINADWVPLAGESFSALGANIGASVERIAEAAAPRGIRPVTIGILPTLDPPTPGESLMTDMPRYRELSDGLLASRAQPFRLRINGEDPLDMICDDVSLEGANTSLQIHLRVEPPRFADTFNAVQLITPLAVTAAGNSPYFLGHGLWEETRIAVFKHATDPRPEGGAGLRPARVCFGHGWVRRGVTELFAEAVYLHEPLLIPVIDAADPVDAARAGEAPVLEALRTHHSSVWRWNRPVYDGGGGHLRIELRSLPSGPTLIDMEANAALIVGLGLGLRDDIDRLISALPFKLADYNFYRAAQLGLDAELMWPDLAGGASPRRSPVVALIDSLLPVAERGLVEAGVDAAEASRLLGVIADRVARRGTGAQWQRGAVRALEGRGMTRAAALAGMLEAYVDRAASNQPVSSWPAI